jgi:hypothetical protein
MKEQWKTIPGFKWHEVSNHGRVRVRYNGRKPEPRKTYQAANGHRAVCFYIKGVPYVYRVSRLVGELFCGDYQSSLYPLFLDGNPSNCRADNLKWVPRSIVSKPPYSKALRAGEKIESNQP